MRVLDLSILANAVYDAGPVSDGSHSFVMVDRQGAAGAMNGFQAAAYVRGDDMCIAYRGTSQAMDVAADLKLGMGMNSTYFALGEDFLRRVSGGRRIVLTGHSLGGAIAQVVANRNQLPVVTFNAPGVAVFASRNVGNATLAMTAVRTAGMTLSALRHPMQAWRDVRSTFNEVHGLNICLDNDAVSKIGIHYGKVLRIPGTSINPLTEHSILTVIGVLRKHYIGGADAYRL